MEDATPTRQHYCPRAKLVAKLMKATGLSQWACYACLRENRKPRFAPTLKKWERVMAKVPVIPPARPMRRRVKSTSAPASAEAKP